VYGVRGVRIAKVRLTLRTASFVPSLMAFSGATMMSVGTKPAATPIFRGTIQASRENGNSEHKR
jgi:hypothetical protein